MYIYICINSINIYTHLRKPNAAKTMVVHTIPNTCTPLVQFSKVKQWWYTTYPTPAQVLQCVLQCVLQSKDNSGLHHTHDLRVLQRALQCVLQRVVVHVAMLFIWCIPAG